MSTLIAIFSFIIKPISDFSFLMCALKHLFLVNTTDSTLFKSIKDNKLNVKCIEKPIDLENKNHRKISLPLKDFILLFFSRLFGNLCKGWSKFNKLK